MHKIDVAKSPSSAESRILATQYGPVEYAIAGDGPVTLVVLNGAGGSFRHGLLMAAILEGLPVRVVGLSRPGYHRTPLESGLTMEAQADLVAAVLDQLGHERAFIIGISAGGMPAIQFALRHSQRCMGVLLLSAVNPAINLTKSGPWQTAQASFLKVSLRYDLPMRILLKYARRQVCALFRWTPEEEGDQFAWGLINSILDQLTPTSLWADGAVNDMQQLLTSDPGLLEYITVPALVVHGTWDEQVPYRLAQHTARTIPGTELLTIEGGSHLILATHWRKVSKRIGEFISENTEINSTPSA